MSEKKEEKVTLSKSNFVRNSLGLVTLFSILLMSGCYWAKYNQPHIDNSKYVTKTANESQPVPHLNAITVNQAIQKNNNTGKTEENKPAKAEPIQKTYETNTIIYPQTSISPPLICETTDDEKRTCNNHNTDITQKDLNDLQKQISDLGLNFADKISTIGSHKLDILISLFVIFGFVVSLFGAIGYKYLKEVIQSKLTVAEKTFEAKIQYNSILSLAISYLEFSYTWWELYDQLYKDGKEYSNYKHQLETAIKFAEKGLEKCKEKIFEEMVREPNETYGWWIHNALKNIWVSHMTVLIANSDDPNIPTREQRTDTIRFAKELCITAQDSKLPNIKGNGKWFDLWETAAFAFALTGNENEIKKGKKYILDLITDTLMEDLYPRPSEKWKEECKEHYNLHFKNIK